MAKIMIRDLTNRQIQEFQLVGESLYTIDKCLNKEVPGREIIVYSSTDRETKELY
jgi:hypothetical protein